MPDDILDLSEILRWMIWARWRRPRTLDGGDADSDHASAFVLGMALVPCRIVR